MSNKTMGSIISSLRKEKSMTQKELADKLNITDKAVSKWERDLSCPDISTIPKLAEILDVSIDELVNASARPTGGHKGSQYLLRLILRAVPMALGIAVAVTAVLGHLNLSSGFAMTGISLACLGLYLFSEYK